MGKDPVVVSKPRCTSVACTHTSAGHCGNMWCGNYRGDCPVHLMAPITERYLQDQVRKQCADLGLTVQHMEDSRRSWVPGWPDLTIIGPGGILWRELKTQEGRPTAEQRKLAVIIGLAGGNWDVWRPRDLLDGRIARELTAITRHGAT